MVMLSPYELDIQAQPEALRSFLDSDLPAGLEDISITAYERIILTGMGSSHYAAIPTWRRLAKAGLPVWWVSTTQLLDSPELITPDTLVWATSQSGASGEIATLVDGTAQITTPKTLLGVTNDPDSPLGSSSDVTIELRSGPEASVSTKTYLNTLAAHARLSAIFLDGDHRLVDENISRAATALEAFSCREQLAGLSTQILDADSPRLALVGKRDHAATALLGGLVLKEAAKVAAQGYQGGEFRHGPLEIAGPGLTAVLFGVHDDPSLIQVAEELTASGALVITCGEARPRGAHHVRVPRGESLTELSLGAYVVQILSVELALARGLVPGEFLFGQKITSAL